MNNGSVDLNISGHIATLLINRPEKLNALTPEMLEELAGHCRLLETNTDVRVVVLKSASPKVFCVGADITRWNALTPLDMWRTWIRRGHQIFDALAGLPQPVIALMNGLSYGGGLELAAAADIRICTQSAKMALPETGLATVPGWSGSQRLTRLVGAPLVKEMAFTGEPVDAVRAREAGLVNRVVDDAALSDAGQEMALQIASRAPVAVQMVKQIIDAADGVEVSRTLEALAGACTATTEDAREGGDAFREKRKPEFKAR